MTQISGINNFHDFEMALSTATASVSIWGSRIISIGFKNKLGIEVKHQLTIPTLIDNVKGLYQHQLTTMTNLEKTSGKRIVTHLIDKLINDCQSSIKNNCLKRIVLAIRDLFSYFFKKLQNKLAELQGFFESSSLPVTTTSSTTRVSPKTTILISEMQDLFSRDIKKYLASESYASLACTNKIIRNYLSGKDNFSFNHSYLKLRYSITKRSFVRRAVPPGIIDMGKCLSAQGSGNQLLLHNDHLIYITPDALSDTFELIKYSISEQRIVKKVTAIPKEAYDPPRTTDQVTVFHYIHQINQDYFYSIPFKHYSQTHFTICVWHYGTMNAVFATEQCAFFINSTTTMMTAARRKSTTDFEIVQKKLNDPKEPASVYQLSLPTAHAGTIIELEDNWVILRSSNSFNVYFFDPIGSTFSLICDIKLWIFDYMITKKFIFCNELEDIRKKTKKIELPSQKLTETIDRFSFNKRTTYKHLIAFHGDKSRSIYIINLESGELSMTIPIGDPILCLYFTSTGSLVAVNPKSLRCLIYNSLTGELLHSYRHPNLNLESWIEPSLINDILFMKVSKDRMVIIDLIKQTVLDEHDIENNNLHSIEDGYIISGNTKHLTVQIDHFQT